MAKQRGGRPAGRRPGAAKQKASAEFRRDDIYEADDVELPEERQANRFDVRPHAMLA